MEEAAEHGDVDAAMFQSKYAPKNLVKKNLPHKSGVWM
jgi:hypothetical protein